MEANGLPSRTSSLTAAARAFGSREPDANLRNPDWVADRLIGPAELALIADHPIGKALDQDFQESIYDPDVFGFAELLKDAAVIEIDYGATQEYKKRRVEAALGGAPANVAYAPIDFARNSLGEVLRRAGFQPGRKAYYICEGVSMYVPDEGMKETPRANPPMHATASTNGSSASPCASAFEEACGVTGGEHQ
jgi:O-methyltransferase involved in polyketide biosynthesis